MALQGTGAVRTAEGGVLLRVRLTPRARRDEIAGAGTAAGGSAITARVRAVPAEGEANEALERLVADWLGVPRRSVSLVAGARGRLKTVAVAGDGVALARLVLSKLAGLAETTE